MSRILLIEDDAGAQLLYKNRLEDLGHSVVVAPTGAIGLMETRASRFDLFLVDIGLGSGIDGYEVCRRLKAIPQLHSVPVVLISGQVKSRDELHKGYQAGCESFLVKGDLTLLEDVVRAMLRLKALQDEMSLQNHLLEEQNRRLGEERQRGADLELALRETGSRGLVFRELAAGRPDGVLAVDSDGVVTSADRGAQRILGEGLEGKHLGSLAPDTGLEAFVRDARTDAHEGYRFDSGGRSFSASVMPMVPLADNRESSTKIVLILDAGKRRVAAEMLRLEEQGIPRRELGPLLEAARRSFGPSELFGSSEAISTLRHQVARVATEDGPVLLRGQAGTGKDFVARAIHFAGARSGPFVPINCGSISPTLLEAELFGQVKGSHPEAISDRPGLFLQADRGTVLLNEISEIPPDLQAKVLHVIEKGEVFRLGSKIAERVDVRLIASSTRDIEELAKQDRFRKDLLQRLKAAELLVPRLSERPGDVEVLAKRFLARYSPNGECAEISPEALWVLEQYDWPGNVRELQDCIARACAAAQGEQVEVGDLSPPLVELHGRMDREQEIPAGIPKARPGAGAPMGGERRPSWSSAAPAKPWEEPGFDSETEPSFQAYERMALLHALHCTGGDKLKAARLLSVGKSTFYRKLKAHDIG